MFGVIGLYILLTRCSVSGLSGPCGHSFISSSYMPWFLLFRALPTRRDCLQPAFNIIVCVTPIMRQLHDVKCHETMRCDRALVFKLVRMPGMVLLNIYLNE